MTLQRSNRRGSRRLDYKKLQNTGEHKYRENSEELTSESESEFEDTIDELVESSLKFNPDQTGKQKVEVTAPVIQLSDELHKMCMSSDDSKESVSKFLSMVEEVEDYVEENPITSLLVVEDLDTSCSRMENYRLDSRSINKEILKSLDLADYEKCYAEKYHGIINITKTIYWLLRRLSQT